MLSRNIFLLIIFISFINYSVPSFFFFFLKLHRINLECTDSSQCLGHWCDCSVSETPYLGVSHNAVVSYIRIQ